MSLSLLRSSLTVVALLASATALSAQTQLAPLIQAVRSELRIPDKYIVVLKSGAQASVVAGRHGVVAENTYDSALQGFSGRLTLRQLLALALDRQIAYIEEDQLVRISNDTVPPGIVRVGATLNAKARIDTSNAESVDVDIAIIDTGIQLTHPDLNVFRNVSYVAGARTGNDDNGHGTHCAGIAAARDNNVGVVGVAPGARLWAVKVLDRAGSGTIANVIRGVDYVTANSASIEVANMSLGGGNSATLNNAIANSAARGVVYVVAAGNSNVDAVNSSPANSPSVICVSAIVDTDGLPGGFGPGTTYGADDTFASFSNYGAVVDMAAPGVNILSTYIGGQYASLSGTSMAAPHVAGAAGLYRGGRAKPPTAAAAAAARAAIIAAGHLQ
ncbi:MAG: S8 family serine peptidase, partial [Verrucomicrobiota bacterium]